MPHILRNWTINAFLFALPVEVQLADKLASAVDLKVAEEIFAFDDKAKLRGDDEVVDLRRQSLVLEAQIVQHDDRQVAVVQLERDALLAGNAVREQFHIALNLRLHPVRRGGMNLLQPLQLLLRIAVGLIKIRFLQTHRLLRNQFFERIKNSHHNPPISFA